MNDQDKPVKTRRPVPASVKGASDSPTSASVWKKKTVGGTLITVPSGNTALIRTPGIQVFLEQGVIPNGLMPLIQDAMKRGTAPSEADMGDILDDPARLTQIIELADAVTVYCCLDPIVAPAPRDATGTTVSLSSEERDPEILYVDEVDFNDKMFIFNVAVGGTADLEKFRS